NSGEVGNNSDVLRKYRNFKKFDIVEDYSDHHYSATNLLITQPPRHWAKKIQEEWRILKNGLPDMIFVRAYESRMDLLRVVIIGAEGTPYHDGLFFFDVCFPNNYPHAPPKVHYHSGGLRMNPNLYRCGKVCLSLLNTWSGAKNEQWVPGASTMLQVLVSIQGMILNAKPYFNEPGYAASSGSDHGEKRSLQYSERTLVYSLKTMVYTMRKPPKDLVIGYFCDHARGILTTCKAYTKGVKVGCAIDSGEEAGSWWFKSNVEGYMKTLIGAFKEIGAENVDEFMPPTPKSLAQKIWAMNLSIFLIFFIVFIPKVFPFSTLNTIPYSDHCNSFVPEATATDKVSTRYPFLEPVTSHYTGGENILDHDSQRSIFFTATRNLFKTNVVDTYKIQAQLSFYASNIYHLPSNLTNVSWVGWKYRRALVFHLDGFWSVSTNKVCMVGSATWYSQVVLVSGILKSLAEPHDSNYFDPISMMGFPRVAPFKYNYTLVSNQECPKVQQLVNVMARIIGGKYEYNTTGKSKQNLDSTGSASPIFVVDPSYNRYRIVNPDFSPWKAAAAPVAASSVTSYNGRQNISFEISFRLNFSSTSSSGISSLSLSVTDNSRVEDILRGQQLFHLKKSPEMISSISVFTMLILTFGYMVPLVLNFEAIFSNTRSQQYIPLGTNGGWVEMNEVVVRIVTMVAFILQFRLLQLTWIAKQNHLIHEIWTLVIYIPMYIIGGLAMLVLNRNNNNSTITLRSYAGLTLDGFLFPQLIHNILQNSKGNALCYSFYVGTTFVRLVPHVYDLYRGPKNISHQFDRLYIYANPRADFYSPSWDIVIVSGGVVLAVIIFLQQSFGGRFVFPKSFRETVEYEMVPCNK
ncbi:ubiquitin-conjugating enzyme 25, partial [Tanacetum coccineum]